MRSGSVTGDGSGEEFLAPLLDPAQGPPLADPAAVELGRVVEQAVEASRAAFAEAGVRVDRVAEGGEVPVRATRFPALATLVLLLREICAHAQKDSVVDVRVAASGEVTIEARAGHADGDHGTERSSESLGESLRVAAAVKLAEGIGARVRFWIGEGGSLGVRLQFERSI